MLVDIKNAAYYIYHKSPCGQIARARKFPSTWNKKYASNDERTLRAFLSGGLCLELIVLPTLTAAIPNLSLIFDGVRVSRNL